MKLKIHKNKTNIDPYNFLRSAGYGFLIDSRDNGKESFARRLGGGRYPRFHMYIQETAESYILDLHIDQQANSIGEKRHKSEYEGERVLEELKRLKQLIDTKK
ncbi:MAG: hypothetical protein ACOCVY_02650 [Patescibacteria group bacterium]